MGIPTAAIEGEVFTDAAKLNAELMGISSRRIVSVPHPTSQVPAAKCRKYVEGRDPITGKFIIDEIINALTEPLHEDEKRSGFKEQIEPRYIGPDSEQNLLNTFVNKGLIDYLPIVLPTKKRVAEMLKGTTHNADEIVGEMRSGYEACRFTVEQVAANAVMAGAKPEYLPVILAMAASGVPIISTSTQSFDRMIVINGPIASEIGMSSGCGALSPFNQANASIQRAATLMAINLGSGGVPNLTYWGSQGNSQNYGHVIFAENEKELPKGWRPFHVQKNCKKDESIVSFFNGYSTWHWKNTYEKEAHKAILHMANWVLPAGQFGSGMVLLLDPSVADNLVNEGFSTKEALSEYVYNNTFLTLEEFWQFNLVEGFSLPAAHRGIEPYASWLKQPKETLIQRFRQTDQISVLVVGGRTNLFWQFGDYRHIGSFSIDEWR
jgi:hypothetical protein